jgi:iron(III) transport system permease protein
MLTPLRWSILLLGAAVVAAPLIQLLFESQSVDSEVWQHLRKNQIPSSLIETLVFSIGSALTALLIGTTWAIVGFFLPRINFVFKISMALLITIPTYVFGFLMLSFFDFSGPLQLGLKNFLGEEYFFEPRARLWAVLIYGTATSPYVYFSVELGLKTQIKSFLEASLSLGVGTLKTIKKVLMPSLMPWALGGTSLVTLEALSDFGFVDLFGINTLSRLLYKSWGSLFSIGGAARISLILIGICLMVMFLINMINKTHVQRENSLTQNYSNLFNLRTSAKIFLYLFTILGLFVFNVIPIATLLIHASELSLWSELPWLSSAVSSLVTAALSGLFVLIFTTVLFFISKKQSKFTNWLFNFLSLGYGLPGTLLAVAFYIFFAKFFNIKVLSDQTGVLFVIISLLYFVKFSSLSLRSLQNQEKQINIHILESASLLANKWHSFWSVEFKMYWPALGLGLFLLFLEIIKELPASLMIKPNATASLAVRIHQYASESDWARASVYSLVMLFIVGLILLFKKAIKLSIGKKHELY